MNIKILTVTVFIASLPITEGLYLQAQNVDAPSVLMGESVIQVDSVMPDSGSQDLEFLQSFIGDAPVVLLGESRHLVREQYLLKHRVTSYLVEEMNFTHVAVEDSFFGTIAIDNYIKGSDLSPQELLENTGAWYLWDNEETLNLIKWLRTFNSRLENRNEVSYVGIDIEDPWPGIVLLKDYFARTDRDYAEFLESKAKLFEVFHQDIWGKIKAGYAELTPEEREEIAQIFSNTGKRLASRREEYSKSSGEKNFRDCVEVVNLLLKAHDYFVELQDIADGEVGIREKTMFENVARIVDTAGQQAKIVVWVHNAHASTSPVSFQSTGNMNTGEMELMGTMLRRKYGGKVKSIGMVSPDPAKAEEISLPEADVLDQVLTTAGLKLGFLTAKGTGRSEGVPNLLESRWRLTADMGGFLSLVPAQAFDGLFFIRETGSVKPSPESAKRLEALF